MEVFLTRPSGEEPAAESSSGSEEKVGEGLAESIGMDAVVAVVLSSFLNTIRRHIW